MTYVHHENKYAFQQDVYHPLVDHIPYQRGGGGVCMEGGCLPRGLYLPGGMSVPLHSEIHTPV